MGVYDFNPYRGDFSSVCIQIFFSFDRSGLFTAWHVSSSCFEASIILDFPFYHLIVARYIYIFIRISSFCTGKSKYRM